ncbi:MAG: RNA polymerase sigma factor [Flavobacteriales bacterium]|nr:RNA polymerase sigma factor [Flavobacteriales bacterium]MCC6939191.1 RNA polymerase sigma factor [Flavobacteriales bacterium]
MSTIEFNQLLLSLQKPSLHFALSLTRDREAARDLLQESILKALMNRDGFRDGTNFKAWMLTIVRNTFINEYRRTVRGRTVMSNAEHTAMPVMRVRTLPDPMSELATNEMSDAVDRLPALFREPFKMNVAGFKYNEISESLNIPIGTVKSRIFEARKRLGSIFHGTRAAA